MNIENALKEYPRKKSLVETTEARIEAYKEMLNNPNIESFAMVLSSREFGMPRSSIRTNSYIESLMIQKQVTTEGITELITTEKSRIWLVKMEIQQIELALKSLTKQEQYLIECKYFEDMFWRSIELSFNEKFRGQDYITESGLRKKIKGALEQLAVILQPFYEMYGQDIATQPEKSREPNKNGPVITYKVS